MADPYAVIERLRGNLQNCVNHLERAKRQTYLNGDFEKCIESANKALYETLHTDIACPTCAELESTQEATGDE